MRSVLAALFLFNGGAKLTGLPSMFEVLERVSFGQWSRYLTGILEVGGAALLLWPPTIALGALLTIVSVGAVLAQLLVLHEVVTHCIVLAVILAAVVWKQREPLRAMRR
jgi:hypothetical protein